MVWALEEDVFKEGGEAGVPGENRVLVQFRKPSDDVWRLDAPDGEVVHLPQILEEVHEGPGLEARRAVVSEAEDIPDRLRPLAGLDMPRQASRMEDRIHHVVHTAN